MKALTKVFNGTELPVEVINDKEFMVDVSGIARKYGKDFRDWHESKRVSETIKKWEKTQFLNQTEMVIKSGNSRKIHNKLLISFARFVSIDFEIWCDDMIYNIIMGLKDEEISKLMAEAKQCIMYDDGFTSARGMTQHIPDFEHTERSFKENLANANYIRPVYKRVKTWELTKRGEGCGFIRYDKHGTLLYDSKNISKILHVAERCINYQTAETVHVYNGFTGEYHCSFPSIKSAQKELGVGQITQVKKGQVLHNRGICFRFGDDKPDSIEPLKNTKKIFREINVFKDNVYIGTYSTLADAGKVAKVGQTTVGRCMKSKRETENGYSFAYAELSFTHRN